MGGTISFGTGGVEYLAFVGLRFDEKRRVLRVSQRNPGGPASKGHEGEHVYMPLDTLGLTESDVDSFWKGQSWGLNLKPEDGLSNCTYCFLKGAKQLQAANQALSADWQESYANSPCDLAWWVEKENKYGRDLQAEGRPTRQRVADDFIGFFDSKRQFSYRILQAATEDRKKLPFDAAGMPCDCTD